MIVLVDKKKEKKYYAFINDIINTVILYIGFLFSWTYNDYTIWVVRHVDVGISKVLSW